MRLLPLIAALVWAAAVPAAEIRFRVHTLNAKSEYSACAVADLNRDGVVNGGDLGLFLLEIESFPQYCK